MHPRTVLAILNQRHATSFRLGARFADGESGASAYAVVDAHGRAGVLKSMGPATAVEPLHDLDRALTRLRARGYPAPRSLVIDVLPQGCYLIQERLPGAPLGTMTPALVAPLLALNLLQHDHAPRVAHTWPDPVITLVLEGGPGYCLLEPLRTYSAATAALLATLQALVARQRDQPYVTSDLVHFDFNPANILVDGGTISGVIDWQAPYAGDCTFDLVTLLWYAWETAAVREQLWQHVVDRAGIAVVSVYLAHMMVRQVDWSIRHHGPAAVAKWLQIAQEILTRCRRIDSRLAGT